MTTVASAATTEQLWFLDTSVSFAVAHGDGGDGISAIWSRARHGDSPPLHVHQTEDEVFHVIEGRLRLSLDGATRTVGAGETIFAPKGVPHTYVVESPEATWLAITTNGDFERFVRALARPAEHDGLPPSQVPTDEHRRRLAEVAAGSGIEFVGPPLS